MIIMFNRYSELALSIVKLPVFYKQRDYLFFPAWAYALPTWIFNIPITLLEVCIGMMRRNGGYGATGFHPLMYAQNTVAVNEFLEKSWARVPPNSTDTLGETFLKLRGNMQEMKAQFITEDRLELLKGVSGAFRPGVLTALMGITGAVYESLQYSAWLRLPREVDTATRKMFIEEVMELVELNSLRESVVGLPGVNGLSTEQRKRLTIAVELVANPSIIFMDKPTSGLDARAAAIVMRTVRNTVDTGRTVVCTIHQPSIDIFDAFDEGIGGVPEIKDGYNPATWMLEITTAAQEALLGIDYAELYKNSELYKRNKALIKELSVPAPAVRLLFTIFVAPTFGTIFWDLGTKRGRQQDIVNAIGDVYAAVMFLGVQNSTAVQPIISIERISVGKEQLGCIQLYLMLLDKYKFVFLVGLTLIRSNFEIVLMPKGQTVMSCNGESALY
ncbi:hypothetical protein K7X08_005633 [Anisodus acutangulus]|uniref:ABC-2 type transporter transmembrane domain-containing protein n=1 Tax=Anisodus acutangulus TaxID=402998 RepID=A0A9Q1R8D5_9SOLA|nr:hypothetical protein K7X08_005633 [Anisodus acutangulus]